MTNAKLKSKNAFNLFFNRYFNIFLAVLLVLILILSYFIFIKPKFNQTLQAIRANIAQQETLYAEQEKKLASLKAVATLYDKITAADLNKFNAILPNDYVKEKLFGELEEIITQNGFILGSVSLTKTAPAEILSASESKSLGEIRAGLKIGAIDYAGLKALLKTLENNLRLFDVTTVSFSPAGQTAELNLTTYYYQPAQ